MSGLFDRPERIDFVVPGEPQGKPRTTPVAFRAQSGRIMARMVEPTGNARSDKAYLRRWASVHAFEDAVARHALPKMPATRWNKPVRVRIDAYFERPDFLLKKSAPDGRIPHDAKPDKDNVEKLVYDVLTKCGLWVDDGRVCSGVCHKWYVAREGRPGIRVRAWTIDGGFVRKLPKPRGIA